MAKNESFEIEYRIKIKGISTNGFVPQLVTDFIIGYVKAINSMYQQTDASVKVTNLKQAKKAGKK